MRSMVEGQARLIQNAQEVWFTQSRKDTKRAAQSRTAPSPIP